MVITLKIMQTLNHYFIYSVHVSLPQIGYCCFSASFWKPPHRKKDVPHLLHLSSHYFFNILFYWNLF